MKLSVDPPEFDDFCDLCDLFDFLAIEVPPGKVTRFAFTDNRSGYFEGFTHSFEKGAGYVLREGTVFSDFTSLVNERSYSRSQALVSRIHPWGTETFFEGIREEFLLHGERRAISLRLHSEVAAKLSLVLSLPDFCPPGVFLALSSDSPFYTEESSFFPGQKCLTTEEAQKTFTLHLTFASSPEEAEAEVKSLAKKDPFSERKKELFDLYSEGLLWTDDLLYNKALLWARSSGFSFLVEEQGKLGIWAGLPWFRENWGRDTFISLPGILLASGRFEEAKKIILDFASLQNGNEESEDFGKVPNRVSGEEILYNTADGTPWFIREIDELLRYTGDLPFLEEVFPFLAIAIEGGLKNRDDLGFFLHGDADTWMDARIEGDAPWSARGNRAIEVQALWYTALRSAANLARLREEENSRIRWNAAADLLKKNFFEAFYDQGTGLFADRLHPDGSLDLKCRPNQLMVIRVPFEDHLLSPEREAPMLEKALGALLYPHGLASLSQEDPLFHPFHENWELYHKDAAYHNGTVWGWNAGFAISAMVRFGHQEEAYALTKNLVEQILEMGCPGTMSELVDALPGPEGIIKPSGAWSQAWSVAEFARNATQDFLGFKPNLLEGEIVFSPRIPWSTCSAILPFGSGARFFFDFFREAGEEVYQFFFLGFKGSLRLRLGAMDCVLEEGKKFSFRRNSENDRKKVDLPFLAPRLIPGLETIEKKDFLRGLILNGRLV